LSAYFNTKPTCTQARFIPLFILYFTAVTTSFSQSSKLDSLDSLLIDNSQIVDSNYVNTIVDLGFEYFSKNPEKAVEIGIKSLKMAQEIKFNKGIADSYTVIGVAYWTLGKLDSALFQYLEASKYYQIINNKMGEVSVYNNIGLINNSLNLIDESLAYYLKAYDIAESINYKEGISAISTNIGIIYLNEKIDYKAALSYFRVSLEIALKYKNNERSIAGSYNNIGEAYLFLNHLDSSVFYFKKGLSMSKIINDNRGIATSLKNLGLVFTQQGKLNTAEKLIQRSLKMSLKDGFHKLIQLNYEELSELYFLMGKFEFSYEYLKKYTDINDSLSNIEIKKNISEIQNKYENELNENLINIQKLELAEKEIELMQKSTDYKNSVFILYLIISILFIIGAIIFFKERINSTKKSKLLLSARLNTLKNQLNPHFLFNSLNVLSSLIHKDSNGADIFIGELSKLYRYILDNFEKDLVLVKDELNFANSFLDIMKVRFGDCIKVTIDVEEGIIDNYKIPPLSLQILLENAVKHNKISETHPLEILVKNEANIYLEISNKTNKKSNVDSTYLGLNNLQSIYKNIGSSEMVIEEGLDTFKVAIPIISPTKTGQH